MERSDSLNGGNHMSETRFDIEIDGTRYRAAEQRPENPRWVQALAYAHRKEITFCRCEERTPVRLSVKHYGAGSGNGHYGLARWPDTGLDHHPDCVFFGDEPSGGDAPESLPAFDEFDNGVIRAHLARPLAIATPKSGATPVNPAVPSRPGKSRARASDVALLLKLWRHARLNIFNGKESNWFMASLRLLHTGRRVLINRAGDTLSSVMLLGTHAENNTAMAHNAQVLATAGKRKTRLYIVGRLRALSAAQEGKQSFMLPLRDFDGLPKATVDRSILDKFLAGRDHMRNVLETRAGNVMVICCIEPSGKDWWRCVDIAGFVATTAMIPVESSYEGEMAHYLIDQERRFIKPIHVDDAGEGGQRPDFILLDTTPRTMVEVWGMQTLDYLANKSERLARYAQRNTPVVSWNAALREPLPVLPPQRSS